MRAWSVVPRASSAPLSRTHALPRAHSLALPLLLALAAASAAAQQAPARPEVWLYYSCNLWVDKNLDVLEGVWRRAAQAGYTHVLLSDSKFSKLGDMDAHYRRNIERVKKLAAELKLEIVPALFSLGYSNDLLWHDPNLAEGLPVRDAPFVVQGGEARPAPEPHDLAKFAWKDDNLVREGDAWRVTDPQGKNSRFMYKLTLQPFRQYHASVQIRTQNFRGTPEIKALAQGRELQYAALGVKPTQDWTLHHVVFNSLERTEVNLYFGCWDGKTGTLWWKAPRLEPAGLLNLLRRPGAPLTVKAADGTVLTEGRDFEPLRDPRMGAVPYKGCYEVWHAPPLLKVRRPDGARLLLSYYHAVTIHDEQVMICPSEPRTWELLRDQARRMNQAWGARGYMMSFDEIRALNWDDSCARRNLDAGKLLAETARECVRILCEVNPRGKIYVWSDMFDPNHNAHKDYYLVRGDLTGSWEGLDKDVVIVAWHFGQREKSLPFFAERGHPILIAGYYDGGHPTAQWIEAAGKVRGVTGFMYTTWERKYDELESFAKTVKGFVSPR